MLKYLQAFYGLVFPNICSVCGGNTGSTNAHICASCLATFAHTQYHLDSNNPLVKTFWGRLPLQFATACFFYTPTDGEGVRNLIHSIKYQNNPLAAQFVGRYYGQQLKQAGVFNTVDVIVPLPLYKAKARQRGYNQSHYFALGLGQALNIEVNTTNLYKTMATQSQTKMTRSERAQNVRDIFGLKNPNTFANKHILLVDDIITTGATIESAALALLQAPNLSLSIAAIAHTA